MMKEQVSWRVLVGSIPWLSILEHDLESSANPTCGRISEVLLRRDRRRQQLTTNI